MIRTVPTRIGPNLSAIANLLTRMASLAAIVCLLIIPIEAKAVGIVVGPDCQILITPPTEGATPTGYRLYYGSQPGARTVSVDLGNVTTATCAGQSVPAGQIYMVARAYNVVGEGPDSSEVPFVLVMAKPGAPGVQIISIAP